MSKQKPAPVYKFGPATVVPLAPGAMTLDQMNAVLAQVRLDGPIRMTFTVDEWSSEPMHVRLVGRTQPVPDARSQDHGLSPVYNVRTIHRNCTEAELVRAAARVAMDIYDHEWREWFRFKGELLFDPHAPGADQAVP